MDKETGLYNFPQRYYDSRNVKWLSLDPMGIELMTPMEQDEDGQMVPKKSYRQVEGLNWYNYCGNNPVMYIDPEGLLGESIPIFSISLNFPQDNTALGVDDLKLIIPGISVMQPLMPLGGRIKGKPFASDLYQNAINTANGNGGDLALTGDYAVGDTTLGVMIASDPDFTNMMKDTFETLNIPEILDFESGDLKAALHRVLISDYRDNNDGTVSMTINDKFNFDWNKSDGLLNAANNFAKVSEDSEAIKPYNISIEITVNKENYQ